VNLKSAVEFAAKEHKEHKEKHFLQRNSRLTLHLTVEQNSGPNRTDFGSLFALFAPFRGSPTALSWMKAANPKFQVPSQVQRSMADPRRDDRQLDLRFGIWSLDLGASAFPGQTT
jgi:hypothetical protein